MKKRVGLFTDLNNLYYCIRQQFGHSEKIDYSLLLNFAKSVGEVVTANAYGTQLHDEASKFIVKLRSIGYTTHYKRPTSAGRPVFWNVGMSLDIFEFSKDLDTIIIASSSLELFDLVKRLNKEIIVIACGIPHELKSVSHVKWIEIATDMLEGSLVA